VQVTKGVVSINGTAVERKQIEDFEHPVTPNSPCYRDEFESPGKNGAVICRYAQFQETLPNGVTYRILDIYEDSVGDSTEAFVVPDGHMFLMGDNRDRSADSRFAAVDGHAIGMVPQENLVGRALVSVFSTDGSAEWIKPWTWLSAARWERIGESF
ncbi:signal peptidase I, partial [Parasphingorhabdus sp.]|uniref:signal peptidase I n=1 Tax=Parasphingorhabdus sp. TaxID=2709688 RepID=UPI003C74F41D